MGADIHGVIATYPIKTRVATPQGIKITDLNLVTMLDRDYDSFAILADVRNEDDFNFISEPRGIPKWLKMGKNGYLDDIENCWLGEHSFSWINLKELLDFDWSQEVTKQRVVPLEEYARWSKDRAIRAKFNIPLVAPREYSSSVSGATVVIHDDSPDLDMENLLGDVTKHHYVRCSWVEKYFETTPLIWNKVIPQMLAQCKKDNTTYARTYFVFGFDS